MLQKACRKHLYLFSYLPTYLLLFKNMIEIAD
jgi:hypothetical protein